MVKINILYCIEYLSNAGTEKQLITLINALKNEQKIEPHLCCLRKTCIESHNKTEAERLYNKIDCPKIQLDFTSFRKLNNLSKIVQLIQFIKQHDINIIQTYFQCPTIMAVLAGKLSGINHIIACFRDMGFWRHNECDLKVRMFYKMCTYYIANSYAVRKTFIKSYYLSKKRFSVIYNGIDLEHYSKSLKFKHDKRSKHHVVIVSNLNREVKRVDVFLKAAAYVLKHNKNVLFSIVGEGSLKEKLVMLAKKLNIYEKVQFLGLIKDIPEMLSKCDIGVISSDSEGFSNSVLEYMAAGLPVIATAVGGNKEIIKHGENGYLVKKGDYIDLGNRIEQLISDRSLCNQATKKAFEMVKNKYTFDQNAKSYKDLYMKLVV